MRVRIVPHPKRLRTPPCNVCTRLQHACRGLRENRGGKLQGRAKQGQTCKEGPFQLPPVGLGKGQGCSIGVGELVIKDGMSMCQVHDWQREVQNQWLPLFHIPHTHIMLQGYPAVLVYTVQHTLVGDDLETGS